MHIQPRSHYDHRTTYIVPVFLLCFVLVVGVFAGIVIAVNRNSAETIPNEVNSVASARRKQSPFARLLSVLSGKNEENDIKREPVEPPSITVTSASLTGGLHHCDNKPPVLAFSTHVSYREFLQLPKVGRPRKKTVEEGPEEVAVDEIDGLAAIWDSFCASGEGKLHELRTLSYLSFGSQDSTLGSQDSLDAKPSSLDSKPSSLFSTASSVDSMDSSTGLLASQATSRLSHLPDAMPQGSTFPPGLSQPSPGLPRSSPPQSKPKGAIFDMTTHVSPPKRVPTGSSTPPTDELSLWSKDSSALRNSEAGPMGSYWSPERKQRWKIGFRSRGKENLTRTQLAKGDEGKDDAVSHTTLAIDHSALARACNGPSPAGNETLATKRKSMTESALSDEYASLAKICFDVTDDSTAKAHSGSTSADVTFGPMHALPAVRRVPLRPRSLVRAPTVRSAIFPA